MNNTRDPLVLAALAALSLSSFGAAQRVTSQLPFGESGYAVDFAGDFAIVTPPNPFTGTPLLVSAGTDNVGEAVLGAPGQGQSAGALEFTSFSGSVSLGFLLNNVPGDRYGSAVKTVDLNGDGALDVVVGAPGAAGGGYVDILDGAILQFDLVSGNTPTLATCLITRIAIPNGGLDGAEFGYALDAEDMDADQMPELVVGAPGAGQVYVYRGPALFGLGLGSPSPLPHAVLTSAFASAGSRFGHAVDIGATADQDGSLDLAIGAPDHEVPGQPELGYAEVRAGNKILGTPPSPGVISSVTGTAAGIRLGHAVLLCKNFNGVGTAELVVGAPGLGDATPPAYPGAVAAFDANTGGFVHTSFSGAAVAGGGFGYCLDETLALIGAGPMDYVVGEPFNGNGLIHYVVGLVGGASTAVAPIFGPGVQRYGFAIRAETSAMVNPSSLGVFSLLIGAPGAPNPMGPPQPVGAVDLF